MTETAKYADVILPGRSFAEKEGTFSNTERRVQRVRKAVDGPEGPQLDTWIFTEIMQRMGYDQPHMTAAQIMDEISSVTPSFGGISHARLDSAEVAGRGLQWPCPTPDHPGTPIMHAGKFTKGLGTYSLAEYRPSVELPDEEYPLMLTTGRILYHYNACAMTARTEGLNEIANSSFIEINTADAEALGIADGDRVKVSSRRADHRVDGPRVGQDEPGRDLDAVPLPGRQQQLAHHRRARQHREGARIQGVRRARRKAVTFTCDGPEDALRPIPSHRVRFVFRQ